MYISFTRFNHSLPEYGKEIFLRFEDANGEVRYTSGKLMKTDAHGHHFDVYSDKFNNNCKVTGWSEDTTK